MQVIKLFLGRIIAGLVASLAGWLAIRWGIVISDTTQAEIVSNVVGLMLVFFSIIYPILHKLFDRKLNPGDAASRTIAQQERNAVRRYQFDPPSNMKL